MVKETSEAGAVDYIYSGRGSYGDMVHAVWGG